MRYAIVSGVGVVFFQDQILTGVDHVCLSAIVTFFIKTKGIYVPFSKNKRKE